MYFKNMKKKISKGFDSMRQITAEKMGIAGEITQLPSDYTNLDENYLNKKQAIQTLLSTVKEYKKSHYLCFNNENNIFRYQNIHESLSVAASKVTDVFHNSSKKETKSKDESGDLDPKPNSDYLISSLTSFNKRNTEFLVTSLYYISEQERILTTNLQSKVIVPLMVLLETIFAKADKSRTRVSHQRRELDIQKAKSSDSKSSRSNSHVSVNSESQEEEHNADMDNQKDMSDGEEDHPTNNIEIYERKLDNAIGEAMELMTAAIESSDLDNVITELEKHLGSYYKICAKQFKENP